jgi:hypothetical protein
VPINERELAAWRKEIVDYRLLIHEDMPPEIARAYWAIIDVIEACIKLSGANSDEQMELVDREIEERLTRRRYSKLGHRLHRLRAIRSSPKHGTTSSVR